MKCHLLGHGSKRFSARGIWALLTATLALSIPCSSRANTDTWTGNAGNGDWNTAGNWNPSIPVQNDSVVLGNSTQTSITVDFESYPIGSNRPPALTLQSITFSDGAPNYTLDLYNDINTATGECYSQDLLLTGGLSGSPNQTIHVEAGVSGREVDQNGLTDLAGFGSSIGFDGGSAGAVTYHVGGGVAGLFQTADQSYYILSSTPGLMYFNNSSDGGSAVYNLDGGSGNGARGAVVTFYNTSSAGSGTYTLSAGLAGAQFPSSNPDPVDGYGAETVFADHSVAGTANITINGESQSYGGTGGLADFSNTSSADHATIINNGSSKTQGLGGETEFTGSATAGFATITNNTSQVGTTNQFAAGFTQFFNSSSAGSSNITNVAGNIAGFTAFRNSSTAATSTISNQGGNVNFGIGAYTYFYDTSTAGNATITNQPNSYGGLTEFFNSSTAGTAHITNAFINPSNGGAILFTDTSSADHSILTDEVGGTIQFQSNSTADHSSIILTEGGVNQARLNFLNNATAASAIINVGPGGISWFRNLSTAGSATITVGGGEADDGYGGNLEFNGDSIAAMSSAGSAVINVFGSSVAGGGGGGVSFLSYSTAGSAIITAYGGSVPPSGGLGAGGAAIAFTGGDAGSSTLIVNGGTNGGGTSFLKFQQLTDGGTSRIVINAGAYADFSNNQVYFGNEPDSVVSVGSIEGAGDIYVGGGLLKVGNLNTDTTFSGVIHDGLPNSGQVGGKLTKLGTGKLTLAGNNTYTGMTTVDGGKLIVTGTVPGPITVDAGGILGGNGTYGNVHLNGGTAAPGDDPATMHVSSLDATPASSFVFELTPDANDEIIVGGNLTLAGTLTFTYPDGYTLGHQGQALFTYGGTLTNNGLKINTAFHNGISTEFVLLMYPTSILFTQKPLLGDATTDGIVNAGDLSALQFGQSHGLSGWNNGDFNQDGIVNQDDIALFQLGLAEYDASHPSVPEPAVACSLLVVFGLRRR